MHIAAICEHMHWTYQQYMEQPQWLLDTISIKIEEEARYQQQQKGK